jgi:hypothetical protein
MPPPPSLQQQQQQPVMNKPLSSVDEISKVLASMNSQDLFTLMSQMKVMLLFYIYIYNQSNISPLHLYSKCHSRDPTLLENFWDQIPR